MTKDRRPPVLASSRVRTRLTSGPSGQIEGDVQSCPVGYGRAIVRVFRHAVKADSAVTAMYCATALIG